MIINRYKKSIFTKIKDSFADTLNNKIHFRDTRYNRQFWSKIDSIRSVSDDAKDKWYGNLDNVQIETVNRCNGECSFCPVNKFLDSRKFAKMDEKVFSKIINELSEVDYNKSLALFSNNEPLIDKRIFKFAKEAREKLPHAHIYIFTNGTLLSVDNCKELAMYLDKIIIDNYTDRLLIPKNLMEIMKECEKDAFLNQIVELHMRKQTEILNTRAGQSPNNTSKRIRKIACEMPFTQLIIRPTGEVSLCCNDALGKMTLGDVSKERIMDIWESEYYSKLRHIITYQPERIELCKYCDARYESQVDINNIMKRGKKKKIK